MQTSRRNFLGSLALLPLVGCGRSGNEEPVLLGHVAPLSESQREAGEQTRRGIVLALDALNDGASRKIVVLHADDRGDGERGRSEAVRLISVNRVLALLGGIDAAEARQLAAAVQSYSVALLTPAALSMLPGTDDVFSLDVSPDFRGESLARFAAEELKATRVAVIADSERPVCTAIAAAFGRKWRELSQKPIATINLTKADEFDKLLARLNAANADLVVFSGSSGDFARIRTMVQTAPAKGYVFAGEEAEWERLQAQAEAARGVRAAVVHAPEHFTQPGQKFLAAYEKRHREPAGLFAFQGWEMLYVLADTLGDDRAAGPARIRDELDKDQSFPGLTGSFTFQRGRARRSLFIIQGGDRNVLKEYKPERKDEG